MTVQQAVDDIVSRGVSELRKSAFGDDAEDAKSLPWSREQAWILMKLLAKKPEVGDGVYTLRDDSNIWAQTPYHEVLMDFPFKGDESPLREMEHSELIAISTHNGLLNYAMAKLYLLLIVALSRSPVNNKTREACIQICL